MEKYILARSADDVKDYLNGENVVSFDFETAPNDEYRDEPMAAIDPHKSHIVGVSFSVKEGTGIYAPIAHKNTKLNLDMFEILRGFAESKVIKIAHNLAFEAMFMYSNNILIQPPVYDTILAAMMTLKTKTEFRTLSDSGLKTIVPQLLHTDLPKFSEVTAGRHFDELNPEDYETIRYACADSDYALQLYNLINSWFDTSIIKVSEELLNDSVFDLEQYISKEFVRRMAAAEENAFINGTGTGRPTGILQTAETGKTTAAAAAITADEVIDLYHSLRSPYRKNAVFIANDSTVKAIRQLKDSNGMYLWQPGLKEGQPDTLIGNRIISSAYMPEIGAGKKPILFGDISYYWIADRQGRTFQRLNELYAATGQVGFRTFQRVDGKLTLAETVKTLVCKAS